MRYVIGIDGGQTTTTAVIADDTGALIGAGSGGPANHIHQPGGVERVRKSLRDAIGAAIMSADIGDAPIASAYLGMTGGSAEMENICRPAVPTHKMVLGHDSVIALYSVTFGKPGVVVIGGTGSVAFGRNEKGETATAGGWGYLMGDEGSGYWIALKALSACTKSADGRGPRTEILEQLVAHFEIDSFGLSDTSSIDADKTLKQIHHMIHSGALTRPDVAALAKPVGRAASAGDPVAKEILTQAGLELGFLAASVIHKLEWHDRGFEVGYAGGVFRAGDGVLGPFSEVVKCSAPRAQIVGPRLPAAVAAALLGLEQEGVTVSEAIISRVKATLPILGVIKQ